MCTREEYTLLLSVEKAMVSHFVECTRGHAGSIDLILPYPPSCNHAWRKGAGKKLYLDPRVEYFRAKVFAAVSDARMKNSIPSRPVEGRVAVMMEFNKADRRSRDLDNPVKQLWDALTFAKVWQDDSQVELALSYFGPCRRGGACRVLIQPLEA